MQFFGLSSRSSLIASFRSAAAGDENRAPWVLAPGKALQVNNKHAAARWVSGFNCKGGLRRSQTNSPSGADSLFCIIIFFFSSKDSIHTRCCAWVQCGVNFASACLQVQLH